MDRQGADRTNEDRANSAGNILEVRGLSCAFYDSRRGLMYWALRDIELELPRGGRLGVIGESGCGKSVTARCIMGLEHSVPGVMGGAITINAQPTGAGTKRNNDQPLGNILAGLHKFTGRWGRRFYHYPSIWRRTVERRVKLARGRIMSLVFQEHRTALNPLMTVGKQLERTIRRQFPDKTRTQVRQEAELWLKKVGLDGNFDVFPAALSGGMSQRVMLALALCTKPQLLIADEPTTNLDAVSAQQVLSLIKHLSLDERLSLMLITHDIAAILQSSSHVVVFYQGYTLEYAPVPTPNPRPDYWLHPYTRFLLRADGQSSPQKRAMPDEALRNQTSSGHGQRCPFYEMHHELEPDIECPGSQTLPPLRKSGDHWVRCFGAKLPAVGGATRPLVEAKGLLWVYPGRQPYQERLAVDRVDLTVQRGEFLGLIGETGCGKSTLGMMLMRLRDLRRPPKECGGTINFDGQSLLALPRKQFRVNFSGKIQMLFQNADSALNPGMRIGHALEETLERHKILDFPTAASRRKRTEELLRQVGLDPVEVKDRRPAELSGGQKRRITVALLLAIEPEFVVADEPTSELDPPHENMVKELLRGLQRSQELAGRNLSMLVISHNISVVSDLCQRYAVMYRGSVVEVGTIIDKRKPSDVGHPYTKVLLDPSLAANLPVGSSSEPPPAGCKFFLRCPFPNKDKRCSTERPELAFTRISPGHQSACWCAEEVFRHGIS